MSFIVAVVYTTLFPIHANAQSILIGIVLLLAFTACAWTVCQSNAHGKVNDDGDNHNEVQKDVEEKV